MLDIGPNLAELLDTALQVVVFVVFILFLGWVLPKL